MIRMKKKTREQIAKSYEEGGQDPIRLKLPEVPIEEFFNEYASTKQKECEIEKKDLRESLQGLVRESFDVLPNKSCSILGNYLNLLDCSQGDSVAFSDVSEVCGITPSGVHNAVKRALETLTGNTLN